MDKKPKILPYNMEAEQSILGCIFMSPESQVQIFSKLNKDDFYSAAHQKIYDAMKALYTNNEAVDYITVNKQMERDGTLEEAGGVSYLVELTNALPSAANYSSYIDIIRNDSILRKIIAVNQASINYCLETQSSKDALENAEKLIMDISKTEHTSELRHISEGVTEVVSRMEKIFIDKDAYRGVKTGFPRLDQVTNGLQKGELILLAARPSVGKSAFAMNIATNAALHDNASVAVFSLEMPITALAQRSLASVGSVPMDDTKKGTNDQNVWSSVMKTKDLLSKARLYIDDSSLIKPMELLSKCRTLKHEHGLDLVVIDYLQLMTSDKAERESRQVEVSEITRYLKIAARELQVPILVLSQMSRSVEQRQDKTPMLSDLRESGSIEQDADVVMFIQREDRSADADEELSPDLDCKLIIAKNRQGELDTIPLKYAGAFTRFYEAGDRRASQRYATPRQDDSAQDGTITPTKDQAIDDIFGEQ